MQPELFIPPHNTLTPDHIAWFPPSLALSALLLFILCTLLYLTFVTWRYRRFVQHKQLALDELAHCWQAHGSLQDANAILKRAVIVYRGNAYQTLHGDAWEAFLLAQLSSNHQARITPFTEALKADMYRRDIALSDAQYEAISWWIRSALAPFSWWRCRGKYEVKHA
jgi:hypothetical protein